MTFGRHVYVSSSHLSLISLTIHIIKTFVIGAMVVYFHLAAWDDSMSLELIDKNSGFIFFPGC